MTHLQVFGQKFTPIHRFLAWKTHPFWSHIPNMTQYGSAPGGAGPRIESTFQVIPGHENPQKRRTMFIRYLFKYCSLNHQKFHQVFENTS